MKASGERARRLIQASAALALGERPAASFGPDPLASLDDEIERLILDLVRQRYRPAPRHLDPRTARAAADAA